MFEYLSVSKLDRKSTREKIGCPSYSLVHTRKKDIARGIGVYENGKIVGVKKLVPSAARAVRERIGPIRVSERKALLIPGGFAMEFLRS